MTSALLPRTTRGTRRPPPRSTNRRVDNTAPTAGLTDPGSPLRQTVTLNATGTDAGSGVLNVAIQRAPTGTSTWTTICTDATSPYSCSWNTTGVSDGGYDLRAVTTDNAGNATNSSTVSNRVVDNTAPTATNVQTGVTGTTPGQPQQGDTLVFTFSEQIAPGTIVAGWNGTGTQNVTVTMDTGNHLSITGATLVNGFITLGGTGYIQNGKAVVFSNSTIAQSGTTVTLTLGAPDKPQFTQAGTTGQTELAGRSGPHGHRWQRDHDGDLPRDLPSGGRGVLGMRRIFLRLEVLAVVIVAICLAVLSGGQQPSRAQLELAAGPGGSLTLSNDKEGAAILSLGGMRPGDSVTDTVTLGNTGTLEGDLSLSTSNLVDTPGGGGGVLSGELDLRIRDVTAPGSPVVVYNGKIDALTPVALGTLTAGAARVYEFRVFFPDAGPGVGERVPGLRGERPVRLEQRSTTPPTSTRPRRRSRRARPPSRRVPDATFAFTSDESGSTFECSVDGAAFASCSSPATFTGLADGAHTFDVRATDGSANTDATPDSAAWTIDATAPNVSLADPGSPLRGTVTLSPSADDGSGSGVASLIVQRSPAGAGIWTTIATSWNTTGVADGSYDLRARATDNAGNPANSPVRTVTVDNTAPSLTSSVPADGELVAAAGSLAIVADENLCRHRQCDPRRLGRPGPAPRSAGPPPTPPPSRTGRTRSPASSRMRRATAHAIAVHFTVWSLAAADYPWIEKNSFPGVG